MAGLEASLSAAEIAPIAPLQFKHPSVSPIRHESTGDLLLASWADIFTVRKSNDKVKLQWKWVRRSVMCNFRIHCYEQQHATRSATNHSPRMDLRFIPS